MFDKTTTFQHKDDRTISAISSHYDINIFNHIYIYTLILVEINIELIKLRSDILINSNLIINVLFMY
jgi:hypothetical protein